MQRQDDFDLGQFDREYGLSDLLPEPMVQDLLKNISRRVPMAVIQPDGFIYCDLSHQRSEPPTSDHASFGSQAGRLVPITCGSDQVKYFALRHELEDIGYLVIKEIDGSADHPWMELGRLIAGVLNQIIQLKYKILMTAGLHVQVVDESYRQLKEKAARLQCSENKYRKLCQNLEAEVRRKAESIKTAQLLMLQQEKLASIGQLAAGMAHEINNPIGFIISNLNTLSANVSDAMHLLRQFQQLGCLCSNPGRADSSAGAVCQEMARLTNQGHKLDVDFMVHDTRALISECLEGAGRISTIVENLRDFAHPSVDTLEHVDINHCLETTLSILSGQISPGISIRKHYQKIPYVKCYLRELNQVFFHILRNALQALGNAGEIIIGTQLADGRTVQVIIADTGPGIPEAHRPHLFEPFFTTRQVGSGAGLGLYLAHNVIKKHGGSISVESKAETGSVFKIRIPVDGPQGQVEPVDHG